MEIRAILFKNWKNVLKLPYRMALYWFWVHKKKNKKKDHQKIKKKLFRLKFEHIACYGGDFRFIHIRWEYKKGKHFFNLPWERILSSSKPSISWVDVEAVEDEVDLVDGDEAILNQVVGLEGVEKLGGFVVSGASSLGGDSTSHWWKQWLLSSLARFHTNDNAKRSVSASGLFGLYMNGKKLRCFLGG